MKYIRRWIPKDNDFAIQGKQWNKDYETAVDLYELERY